MPHEELTSDNTPNETPSNEAVSNDDAVSNDAVTDPADDETSAPTSEGGPGAPLQPHGDPLLASARGANDGDDGSRHGWAATAGIGREGTADIDPDGEEGDG